MLNSIDFIPISTDIASFVLRIVVGVLILIHGYSKLRNYNGTKQFIQSLNIPVPELINIWAVLIEFFGGFLLILGFATQLVALGLTVHMISTTLLQKFKFKNQVVRMDGKPGYELDLLFLVGALALIFLGGGAFSIDAFIKF